jgi:hypothetical protein
VVRSAIVRHSNSHDSEFAEVPGARILAYQPERPA